MSRSITSSDANGATFETVGSTGGFSAGDLIYYGTTGYNKIPSASVPTTASSTLTKAYPTLPATGTSGGYFQSAGFAGLGYSRAVALLSNGNAVAVYGNPIDGYPYFVIYNPTTHAIVVGPTVISTVYIMGAAVQTGGLNIGVSAFTGGNFLVYWGNSAGGVASRVNYSTYTNAGVAVVAVTQDATLAVNNLIGGCMRGITLANGGFVLAFGFTNDVSFRAYDATGVGQFAWVTLSTFASGSSTASNPAWGLTARSDNTYLLAGQSTTATLYNYAIYNYTGTAVVAATTFAVTGGTTNGKLDCATLSDGTTFVIAYAGQTATSTQGWNFRFLPTGNVLGAVNYLQGNFNSTSGNTTANYVRVWPLSALRFLITGNDSSGAGAYAVFNSTATPLLGVNGVIGTASNTRSFGSNFTISSPVLGVIESGGNAIVYSVFTTGANYAPPFFKIELTTYNMVSSGTASGPLTIPTATTPTSGYIGTNSTPSKASFALSNGVYPYAPKISTAVSATAAGVYPIPVSVINGINSFDMCVLSNGNICVVATAGSTPSAYIYNPITLALISSADISSVTSSASPGSDQAVSYIRVTPLSGGSFCVANGTSATSLRLTAFTSSFIQQGSTVNITTISQTFAQNSSNFALCTISGDRVVVVYQPSATNLNYAVYSSTLAAVVAGTTAVTDVSTVQCSSVCASINGFTVSAGRVTAATYSFYTFYEYSANLFTQPTFATGSVGLGTAIFYTFTVANNTGVVYAAVRISATNASVYGVYTTTNAQVATVTTATTVGGATVAVGITAAGAPYLIYQDTTNKTTGAASPNTTVVLSLTGWTAPTTRSATPQIRSIPLYGNMVLVAYLVDTGNALAFGTLQINGSPDSAVFTTSDATNGSPIYPLATTTVTPSIANFTFAGVAVTDCTAGGTGVIQTTGTTNLNSTYPATTAQTFDYTGQVAPGLKGTISGRGISMRKS